MKHTLLVPLVLSFLAMPFAAHAAEPTPPGTRVVYGGKLQDAQGRPIAGVYPLTFNFYRAEKGGRPTWSEGHYVAVDNGVYAVELGGKTPFPKNVQLDKVWLGVAVSGGKEILREKFASTDVGPAPTPDAVTPSPNPTQPNVVGVAPAKSSQSYADLAGYAYEAKKAESADSIGGMTADALRELVKSGAGAATKPKIGAAKRFSEQVGGTGGQPYTLQCPPGHVVTGIKGGAAAYLDSISLICSPIE